MMTPDEPRIRWLELKEIAEGKVVAGDPAAGKVVTGDPATTEGRLLEELEWEEGQEYFEGRADGAVLNLAKEE